VASNFACIGLAVDDSAALSTLVSDLLPSTMSIGIGAGETELRRWEDPSGARIVFGIRERKVTDLLPSFAGPVSARLAGVAPTSEDFAVADVVDDRGEMSTRLQLAIEEQRFLELAKTPVAGPASMTALGNNVALFQDETTFQEASESLLDSSAEPGPAPPHIAEKGMKWPLRVASESFMSTSMFSGSGAEARLYGTVLKSERRIVAATAQPFVAATVRTVGFEATVCIPGEQLSVDPQPGNILGGWVYMVASMPSLIAGSTTAPSKRRGLRRRRG
jgi:hypothetical protein